MNEMAATISLRDCMDRGEGWGRDEGRSVHSRLMAVVEKSPGILIFRVSLDGVERIDISFASETVVEIASRFRGKKGFCLIDFSNQDILENLDAAAERKAQPIMVWNGEKAKVIGIQPKSGAVDAFNFALEKPITTAAEYKESRKDQEMSISNASMKFKQLWQHGFLLRRESVSDSGGVEFTYLRIK